MEIPKVMQAVRDFIRSRFDVPESDVEFTDDVHLFDYGYVDSFGAVELTSFVEKHCSIRIYPSDLVVHPLNSIREVSTFAVKRKRGEL